MLKNRCESSMRTIMRKGFVPSIPAFLLAGNGLRDPIVLPKFDLSKVVKRVAKEHPDWDSERLAKAELGYRRFMTMAKEYPRSAISPTSDIDEMWHAHILHTKDYGRDCMSYLGHFMHHEPFGETKPSPEFDNTAALYLDLFGEEYAANGAGGNCCGETCTRCKSDRPRDCRRLQDTEEAMHIAMA